MRESDWSRRGFLMAMAAGTGCALAPPLLFAGSAPGEQVRGWVLRDVRLVDGSGAPAKVADVLVRGDRIEHIGPISGEEARGLRVVDGLGRVLAHGFIDLHTTGVPLTEDYQQFSSPGLNTVLRPVEVGEREEGVRGVSRS